MDIPRQRRLPGRRPLWIAGGGGVLLLLLLLLAARGSDTPAVSRAAVYVDSVVRGELVRDVRGPGTLVPEAPRYISAVTSGRVERVALRPGASVDDTTVLLVLSNPDVQIQALNADRQLAEARADLVTLRTDLETAILAQASQVEDLRQQAADAQRRAAAGAELVRRGYIVALDQQEAEDRARALTARLGLEEQRLTLLRNTQDEQVEAQRAQVERLRAIARFQHTLARAMVIRAGTRGVVQEITQEVGQYALAGTLLARVIPVPMRLKAVLEIPETQAAELAVGQPATIDTRNGVVPGRVARIDPASTGGAVIVDVALDGALPPGARPDLQVHGTIELDRVADAVYVGRPALAQPHGTMSLFRLEEGGRTAIRVAVRVGRVSSRHAEVVSGLAPGDRVIVSDMSRWEAAARIRLQ